MTMKFTTIALAVVFALSGTFALAQGTGTAAGSTEVQNGTSPATSDKMNQGTGTTGSNSGTGGSPMNSSQADYNSSLKDGSIPGSSTNTNNTTGTGNSVSNPGK
jgi:hypothetical protein